MNEHLSRGEDLCLVTVIASSGSTPRGAGSRMLVGKEGRICGTIGGGNVEHRSRLIAQEVIEEKSSKEHDFRLNKDDVENLGMICGGLADVFFRYIPAGDETALGICSKAEELFSEGSDIWLAEGDTLEISGSRIEKSPGIFVEQINSSGRVYIFGCGHVGQALVPVLSRVGFRCVVLDDREQFANRELFPDAEDVIVCDFEHISDYVAVTENDYCCVMTRGHGFDAVVEAQLLMTPAYYIGVIGSRHKAAGVNKKLVEEYGVPESEISRITTPIGLAIKAETPDEIAVSIAGQMIEQRAIKNGK